MSEIERQQSAPCTVCAGAGEIEGTGGGMRPCPQCVGELGPAFPPDDDE